ncbi:unnamed protein product [Somion occarium]|uniref:F-box domain-containing protein n=1 Tax=Somion occarium TaxID=3059160 RepID=A0ABP1E2K9_9APHY
MGSERDSGRSLLTRLPIELLVQILSILDGAEIVRCKKISRYFKSIVDDNVLLQYIVELDAAGYYDIRKPDVSLVDRLKAFRNSQRAWRDPRPKCIIAGMRTEIPSYARMVEISYRHSYSINYSMRNRSTSDCETAVGIVDTRPVLEFSHPKFTREPLTVPTHEGLRLSPDMDLMVAIQRDRFLFLTLEGKPHPLAARPNFQSDTTIYSPRGWVDAAGSFVVLVQSDCLGLSVYDWISGDVWGL